MAHKKGVGSSKNGRESQSKRLGVKIFGGEVFARQVTSSFVKRGTEFHPVTTSAWVKTTLFSPW